MTKTNEIAINEMPETELEVVSENIVRETDDYVIAKNEKGKFVRTVKYHDYSSLQPTTTEEKIWLFNVLNGGDQSGAIPMAEVIGSTIEVENIITREYDSVNEDTGEMMYGVLTYLITPEKKVFVTSGKAVYFTIDNLMKTFGTPDSEEWTNIKLKISSVKQQRGQQITVTLVG